MKALKSIALFSTAYLGPVSYYAELCSYEKIYIEAWETYPKQTYRNRCCIAGPNGKQLLSIPTLKEGMTKRLTGKVRISYKEPWQIIHWRSILTAYSNSPYFLYYRDRFEPHYFKQSPFLIDFNQELMETALQCIGVKVLTELTNAYSQGDDVRDYRQSFNPKNPVSRTDKSYFQVFNDRHGFIDDLSILDLIFNLGPDAMAWMRK